MNSHLTEEFRKRFVGLPERVKRQAKKNYQLWRENPHHPSLDFKLVGKRTPSYSVRVGIGWRALGYKLDDTVIWFWIGSHADYDKILKSL